MNQHDRYGKKLIKEIAGERLITRGSQIRVHYDGGVSASIDAVVEGTCAIEIESRVAKQIRGALVDLIFHELPNKLLIIIPVHMSNPEATAIHCRCILDKLRRKDHKIEVVLLSGTGDCPEFEIDKERICQALETFQREDTTRNGSLSARICSELLELGKIIEPMILFPALAREASELAITNPYAFAIACCLDRGMKSEIIWTIPFDIRQYLGSLDPYQINQMSLEDISLMFNRLPRKPRYIHDAPQTLDDLTRIVVLDCDGDASKLWEGKLATEVRRTFESIHGVGPGLANMAVLLIEKAFNVSFTDIDHHQMDIKPDVHTIRVLFRLGVSSKETDREAVEAARSLNPDFPGEIDGALWYIGREWCHANRPSCIQCPMEDLCLMVDVDI